MKFILICGLPGSGKTTLAKKLQRELSIETQIITDHFEADMWMVNHNGEYEFNPKKLDYCHKSCQKSAKSSLAIGHNVIVSNTTLTKKEAFPYIEMAKYYGAIIEIIHLEKKWESIHNVPHWKIEQMKAKREMFKLEDFD